MRPPKGKAFLLANYGLELHFPAVKAELCLEAGVAASLHNMLVSIRAIKLGIHKGNLRASAAPLPKKEPWFNFLAPGPTPISKIMNSKRVNLHDNIRSRGERGDHRELRPSVFLLKCPFCGIARDCSRVKLFTTTAKGLTCNNCKKSTSSTRWWCCEQDIPWTSCPIHREAGFRCGVRSVPGRQGLNPSLRQGSLKALRDRQARLSKIGSLGEPKSLLISTLNSGGPHLTKRTLVQKKTKKRQGNCPAPKRAGVRGRLGMLNNSQTSIGISNDDHHCNSFERHATHTTSIFWLAHSRSGQPGENTSSDKHNTKRNDYHSAGSASGEPHKPAKIARLCEPFSRQAPACKGNCPSRWTIESYREACHG
jgi:hypothetical protein